MHTHTHSSHSLSTRNPPPKVCSVDMRLVEKLCGQLKPRPRIISLNPFSLEEVLQVRGWVQC